MRVPKTIHYLARTGERLKIRAENWQAAIHKKEDAALGRGGRG